MCRRCCRSSLCSSSWRCSSRWTSVAWGGRGSPTFPGLWGRVMAARATTCQAEVHGHSTRHLATPAPCGPPGIPGRLVGCGFSLQGADGSMEAGDSRVLADGTEAGLALGAWLTHHSLHPAAASAAPHREQLCPHLARHLGKALPSLGLRFSGDERANTVVPKGFMTQMGRCPRSSCACPPSPTSEPLPALVATLRETFPSCRPA